MRSSSRATVPPPPPPFLASQGSRDPTLSTILHLGFLEDCYCRSCCKGILVAVFFYLSGGSQRIRLFLATGVSFANCSYHYTSSNASALLDTQASAGVNQQAFESLTSVLRRHNIPTLPSFSLAWDTCCGTYCRLISSPSPQCFEGRSSSAGPCAARRLNMMHFGRIVLSCRTGGPANPSCPCRRLSSKMRLMC